MLITCYKQAVMTHPVVRINARSPVFDFTRDGTGIARPEKDFDKGRRALNGVPGDTTG